MATRTRCARWIVLSISFSTILLSATCAIAPALAQSPVLKRTNADSNPDYKSLASSAVKDLLTHFWVKDADGGHILDTYNGYARKDDPRGVLWERSTFVSTLTNLYQVTKDPKIRARIVADWAHVQKQIPSSELQSCGVGSQNVGQDDAAWAVLMYLNIFKMTGDNAALVDAEGLFQNACARWADHDFGGGLWYSDQHQFKSSYQAALIVCGIRLWQLTHNIRYHDLSIAIYDWVETRLRRPDELYWCDLSANGPQGSGTIREASSDTFLGGNMAMGVAHALLFKETRKPVYKQRALRTAKAIRNIESDGQGCYLDDRDAWANGFFMGDWAAEVLTLSEIDPADRAQLSLTALAVATKARTPDGYFSGSWGGPAVGDASAWWKAGSRPQQIMTSANAVNVIVAAAQLATTGTK